MFPKNPKFLVYSLVVLAAFLLIFVRSRVLTPVKFTVVQGTSLPVRILSFPFRELKKLVYYHRTFDEYIRVRSELKTLKTRLIGFEEVMLENNRLEKLLELKRRQVFSSIAAGVIGRDPSNWNAAMVIDKGTNEGLALGMPAVNTYGVVGKVAELGATRSKVILVTDPGFSVVALVKRSREVGLVSGTLQGMCRMRYLSGDADVQVGDTIITSKLSSSFPEGLMIGEVVSVRRSIDDPSIECLIRPAVQLSQIEEVLVIRKE